MPTWLGVDCEFFTQALADGLSLESERQQVSLSLQDSSQYSGPYLDYAVDWVVSFYFFMS